jgi:hypothetical protein
VGVIAYQLGLSAGTTQAAVSAGATVVYAAPGVGFGSLLGLLFFGLLFLAIVGGFVKRIAWSRAGRPGGSGFGPGRGPWMMHGGWGHGGPDGRGSTWGHGTDRPVPPPFDEMLGRWHDQAHGTAPTSPSPTAGATGQAGTSGTAPTDQA